MRAFPAKVPALTARQFAQAQFHWGNPPPAAEPRILICMVLLQQVGAATAELPVNNIQGIRTIA